MVLLRPWVAALVHIALMQSWSLQEQAIKCLKSIVDSSGELAFDILQLLYDQIKEVGFDFINRLDSLMYMMAIFIFLFVD